MAKGTQEKVQTCKRGKAPLLGRGKEEGGTIGNSLHQSMCRTSGLEGRPALQRLWVVWSKWKIRCFLCRLPIVWAKGTSGLSVMWCLLHYLQVVGTDCGGHLRGQKEAWLAITGGLGVGSTCKPSHLRVWQKRKKQGTATKHHRLLHSLPWEHTNLKLPLPNTLGGGQTPGHGPFPRSYN